MKYLIKEIRLINLIGKYIEAKYPKIFELKPKKAWHQENGNYAIMFIDDSNPNSNFMYWKFNPYLPNDDTAIYPELQLNQELFEDIESVFGEENLSYVMEWFNKTFGFEAQSITF